LTNFWRDGQVDVFDKRVTLLFHELFIRGRLRTSRNNSDAMQGADRLTLVDLDGSIRSVAYTDGCNGRTVWYKGAGNA